MGEGGERGFITNMTGEITIGKLPRGTGSAGINNMNPTTPPIKIRMTRTIRSDFPLGGIKPGTVLKADQEYYAHSNPQGAISGICDNGEKLGVKPGEFEFIKAPEWVLRIWAPHDKKIKCSLENTGGGAQ